MKMKMRAKHEKWNVYEKQYPRTNHPIKFD